VVGVVVFGVLASILQGVSEGTAALIIGIVVVLAIIAIVVAAVSGSRSACDVCGAELKRTKYQGEVDGKRVTMCANCNRRIASHVSRVATDRLLGKTAPAFTEPQYRGDASRSKRVESGLVESEDRFYTKLVGVKARQGAVANCDPGEPLQLREYHDRGTYKIAAFNEEGELVGFLNAKRADPLLPRLQGGERFIARVAQVTGQDQDTMGVNIEVWKVG